jgi:hypothetical protein
VAALKYVYTLSFLKKNKQKTAKTDYI